jgi:hypothetical protein
LTIPSIMSFFRISFASLLIQSVGGIVMIALELNYLAYSSFS